MTVDPAKLRIVLYPDPVLRERAAQVAVSGGQDGRVSEEVVAVAARMLELMREARGVGLAAPQVGLPWRMFVANWTGEVGEDHVFINPELVGASRETAAHEEGCLSLPEIAAEVTRPTGITVRARGLDGSRFEMTEVGTLAVRVWQHEFDHLEGVLILDRMTRLDKRANRRAVLELEEAGG